VWQGVTVFHEQNSHAVVTKSKPSIDITPESNNYRLNAEELAVNFLSVSGVVLRGELRGLY
jgi:hypothetical protein